MSENKQLPKGWEWKMLGEVCEVYNGSTPLRKRKEYWENGNINWFTINDIRKQGRFIEYASQKITEKGLKESSLKLLPPESILICCTASVGEYAIAKVNITTNQQFNGLVIKKNISLIPMYLFYFSSTLKRTLLSLSGKATINFVSMTKLKKIPIPVPPLTEQKQIVQLLDKAFANIDRARANIERNIHNARELFQSKLNDIFSQQGEGWEEKKLGEVCENLDRQRIPITKSKRVSGEIPYYGASGVVDHVNEFIFDEDLLLVSEDGANLLTRTYPIAFSISGKTWVNNHAHVLRFSNMATQKFVEYYLNSIKLDEFISGMAQPKLNQRKLNSICGK